MGEIPIFWFGKAWTKGDFRALVDCYATSIAEFNGVFAVYTGDPIVLNAAIIASLEADATLYVFHEHFEKEFVAEFLARHSIPCFIKENSVLPVVGVSAAKKSTVEGGLVVFTSGTTGKPKAVHHNWSKLKSAAAFVPKRLAQSKWLMAYSSTSFAGLQVFFSAYLSEGQIVYQNRYEKDFTDLCRLIVEHKVDVISATPTFWRMIVAVWQFPAGGFSVKQATLGGEIVTQDILDAIRGMFKPERITHIYASTEAGSSIVVTDGREGFPLAFLEKSGDVEIQIRDDALYIRSPRSMSGYIDSMSHMNEDWIDTGDLVEVIGERVFFRGRADGCINVGGSKVMPEEIERVVASFPGIVDCRIYQKKSPITGAIIALDIVTRARNFNIELLRAYLRSKLTAYKFPRQIKLVEKIEVSQSGKKARF